MIKGVIGILALMLMWYILAPNFLEPLDTLGETSRNVTSSIATNMTANMTAYETTYTYWWASIFLWFPLILGLIFIVMLIMGRRENRER